MILIVLIILVILYEVKIWMRRKRLPPGPPCLPLVGSLPFTNWTYGIKEFLSPKFYKYGKVVKFEVGLTNFFIINDFNTAKELFNVDAFNGRFAFSKYIRSYRSKNKNLPCFGIGGNEGKSWVDQRRFSLKALRDFGFGKKSLDAIIQEEVKEIIELMAEEFEAKSEVVVDENFNIPMVNIIWQITASKRIDRADPECQKSMEILNVLFKGGLFNILTIYPFLMEILPVKMYGKAILPFFDMIRNDVLEHEATYNPDEPPRDFIDVYLKEIYSGHNQDFHREQLVNVCADFFAAGSETSSTMMKWSIMFLVLNPDVQRKCQEEIDQILGKSLPSKDDLCKLTYVNATLQEVLRLSSLAPAPLVHQLNEDYHHDGYLIPKDSILTCNLKKFNMDPTIYGDPENFRPERFICNGSLHVPKELVPFGIGKRICMGETMGRHTTFIFFTMLFQNLTFSQLDHRPKPNPEEHVMNLTSVPNPFYVKVMKR